MSTVAVVTGANKGIGYWITKNLLLSNKLSHVILTARNTNLGKAAQETLSTECHSTNTKLLFHQLDIEDEKSIDNFSSFLSENFPQGLNILVNNAGFAFKNAATEPFGHQAKITIGINFFGTLKLSQKLISHHLNDNSCVVNVCSRAGLLSKITNPELKNQLSSDTLTLERLETLMNEFVQAAEKNEHQKFGWPNSAYGTSKIGEGALTRVHAKMFPKIHIFGCCPGWCRTDMAGDNAPRSAEEGADTPTWLALSPPPNASGSFFGERKQISWEKLSRSNLRI